MSGSGGAEKIRVLQLITRSDWAGAQKVLYSLVYGFKKFFPNEIDVEVACGKQNGMLISELGKIGVKVHEVQNLVREISPLKDIKAYIELKKLIECGEYDIVHVHSSKAGFLGRIAARSVKVPLVVYTVHGWWPIEQYSGFKRKAFVMLEKFAAGYCDKIVLLGERDRQKAQKWGIGRKKQYVVIPNAIIPEPKHEKGLLRKELGLQRDIKIVGNVARLAPPKNPIRFLRVANEVLKERNDVVFVWIGGNAGEGEYGARVVEFLRGHRHLDGKVFFLPFRKDVVKLMADFDVFLLTSDSEGMPLVILEALNQDVPVVSMDVGCVGEMIEEPYLVRGEKELKEKVVSMLDRDVKLTQKSVDLLAFLRAYIDLCLHKSC